MFVFERLFGPPAAEQAVRVLEVFYQLLDYKHMWGI